MSVARFNIINSESSTLQINSLSSNDINLASGGGNVIINNDLSVNGIIQTPTTIDTTNVDALLIRKNTNGGDVFSVNTSDNIINITSSKLLLSGSKTGIPSNEGQYINIYNYSFTDNSTAASGTADNMAFNSIDKPILNAVNSSVTTLNCSTVYIQGAPISGTNQSITNSYSLWINDGITRIDNILNLTGTTASSSPNNGILTISGGIGISNTTDAISSVNGGTFTTAGGAAIAKKLYIGSELFVKNGSWTSGGDEVIINANSNSIYLRTSSGSVGGEFESSVNVFKFRNSLNTENILEINKSTSVSSFAGQINSTNSISSTSNSSGSLLLNGGIGISNTSDAVSITNGGTFTTAGGVAIAKKLFVGGAVSIGDQLNMNSNKIINLDYPTSNTDAATKSYVDSVAQGLSIKNSVIAATTGPNNLNTDFQNGSTLDGVTLSTGNRVLIKDQSSSVENGIYIVQASGVPLRSSDFASSTSQSGSFVFVDSGNTNDNSGFVVTSNPPNDIVGTNSINFTQFSGAGQITAGTGLSKSGNTLSVNSSLTNVTQVGTLTSLAVNGAISGTSLNLSGLTASQAVLTDGSKNLISVATTGTGNVVLQTNPSLITPIIGAASGTSLTLTGNLSSSQGVFSDKINLKNTSITSTNDNIILNANSDSIFIRNNVSNSSGEFESSTSIFKFRNTADTLNILEINKSNSISTFNGQIYISLSTSSTSSNTGAFKTAGGIGISNSTDAVDTTNGGSFTTAGGAAIAKKLIVGTSIGIGLDPSYKLDIINNGITARLHGSSDDSSVIRYENSSIGGRTYHIGSTGTNSGSGAGFTIFDVTSSSLVFSINANGSLTLPTNLISTSSASGVLILNGGIGISDTTDAISSTNGGTFTTSGGVGIGKKLYVGTNATIGNTTYSNGLLNIFGDLSNGGIRLLPNTSGTQTSIGFYRNNDGTLTSTGDLWTIGTTDREFYIENNTRTSLSILSASNAVVIGKLNQDRHNILTFGGLPNDTPLDDTGLFSVIVERSYNSSEDKINNPSILSSNSTNDYSELLLFKGNDSTLVDLDRVRVVTPSFAIDIPSGVITYDGQADNISVVSGKISRALEILPTNRTISILNNTEDTLVSINPCAEDIIRQKSFNAANNQGTVADITGLSFSNTVTRSFKIQMSVVVDATTKLFAQFNLEGINNGSSWYFISNYIGDDTLVTFSINNTGQLQYTSSNYSGFVSLTMNFRGQTISI